MTHRASVDGTRSDEYSDDSRTPKAGKSSTIRLPPGPPPRFPGTLKRSQSHRAITRQLMGKSEMRASFDSVDSSDAAGMYLSVEDVPLQKSAGLNFKGSTNLKRKPDKSAGSTASGFVSVNIGDDEEYVGRPDKSNASIASTEIPRYTFAPTKPGASVFHLAGLDRQKTVITPKDGLSRSFTANSYRMKRDKSEKPISEFDPQNKNISAIQQDRARSRRTSLAYSIMGSKHTTNTSRRTSTSYSIHQRRDSHILQPHLRKYSADPSVQSSTIARERTPKSSAQSEHLRRSYISLDLQQESMAELTLYQKCMCFIVLPAYDNKGRNLTLDQFDEADFEAISFNVNGLHPKSYFITLWDFLTSFGYCAVLWIIPFLTSYVHELPADLIWMCSILFTVFFAIDSIISLITPQPRTVNLMGSFREYESMRPALSEWMIDWIRGNLILEGISMIPFELIFHDKDYYIFLFWLRFLRFPRLGDKVLRCAYFTKAKLWADKLMGMGFSKIVPIAFGIFYFIHFNACAIYLTGSREGFLGWSILWPQFDPSAVYQVYTWTFFQAVGNIFPMSFKPQTAFEQAFAIVFIVIGAVLYAAFVGYVSSAAMSINPSGRLYNQKMEELIDYVRWKNLSEETKDKLVSYYETKYRGKYFEEDTLLSDMNESLREEIALHNTQRLIEKVPFLQRNELDGRDEIFFHRIATVLHAHYFIPGDFIIKQGDSGNEMYFILSGKVNVYVNGAKVVSLYDGAYLGEVSLITRHLRTATVQAVLPCVLYKLTRHDFHAVINEFPDMKNRIEKLAREAERMVKQAEESKQ
ncbi:hypothetical protein BDR26DRAFT_10163 [Obelidium mucronatum]|nr:hypothetical protein BDR26DRAFT_10163 [Obelidium mucronatum]